MSHPLSTSAAHNLGAMAKARGGTKAYVEKASLRAAFENLMEAISREEELLQQARERLRQDQSQVDSKMEQLNAALDMTSRMHTSCELEAENRRLRAEQAAMQKRSLDQSHLNSMMEQLNVALDTSSELGRKPLVACGAA